VLELTEDENNEYRSARSPLDLSAPIAELLECRVLFRTATRNKARRVVSWYVSAAARVTKRGGGEPDED